MIHSSFVTCPSEINDHSAIKIIFDVRQKYFGKLVVRDFAVAVAVSVDHRFVHNLLQLRFLNRIKTRTAALWDKTR